MNFEEWNLNNDDKVYLIILFIVLFLSTSRMLVQSLVGCISNPDIAIYLLTALKYAGLDSFNLVIPDEIYYTPIISFLSSIFFRMGYVDKNAIIIVTTVINFIGYFGLYILLRNRFNSLLSFTGVLIYGSLPLIIVNSARGMIDLSFISISIWVLVFAIRAIDKNPKYFLIVLSLLVIGFFTKYTVGFMLPLIVLYYVINRNVVDLFDCFMSDRKLFKQKVKNYFSSKEFKYIIISVIVGICLFVIISKTLILDFGGYLTFFQQSSNTFNGNIYSSEAIDFNMDKSYYLDHFSQILYQSHKFSFILSGLLIVILALGAIIKIGYCFRNISLYKAKETQFKTKHLNKILFSTSTILIIVAFLLFKVFSNHLLSNICLLVSFTLLFSILQKYNVNDKKLGLDVLFLAYFLISFIFISSYAIKVPRYALIFIPPLIYFVIWGLNAITNAIFNMENLNQDNYNYIVIIIVLIFLVFTCSFVVSPMEYDDSGDIYRDVFDWDFDNDLIEVCNFIKEYDSDYHNKSFSSDYHHSRLYRWYLNVNMTVADNNEFPIDYNQTDYILTTENITLNNYVNVYHHGLFYVFYKDIC